MRGMMALENDFYFVERKCVMMMLCSISQLLCGLSVVCYRM